MKHFPRSQLKDSIQHLETKSCTTGLAPAIGFYKGGMTDKIVIAGHLGISMISVMQANIASSLSSRVPNDEHLEAPHNEVETNGPEEKEPKNDKQLDSTSLRMEEMDQGLEPNRMSDLYGQEINEEEAEIYLRSLSSQELKALTAKDESWYKGRV